MRMYVAGNWLEGDRKTEMCPDGSSQRMIRSLGMSLQRRYRPAGTYFVTTDIRPFGESDGIAFCRELPRRAGVVAVPLAVLYDNQEAGASQVRFAFCKRTEVLEEALTRLRRLTRPG